MGTNQASETEEPVGSLALGNPVSRRKEQECPLLKKGVVLVNSAFSKTSHEQKEQDCHPPHSPHTHPPFRHLLLKLGGSGSVMREDEAADGW